MLFKLPQFKLPQFKLPQCLLALALLASVCLTHPPSQAEPTRFSQIWVQVYEQLPNFPQENQYKSLQTNQPVLDDTLARRLIRYHVYVKGRPAQYRLDWKLTLADYLGVNELMDDEIYPSHERLKPNPMMGDRAAINQLSRQEREQLIDTLVGLFNPAAGNSRGESSPQPGTTNPAADPIPTRPTPTPPRSGGAELLK
jgi:hypothetical protein